MTVELIRSYTHTGGKHVGDLLWWTLADARITRSDARDRLDQRRARREPPPRAAHAREGAQDRRPRGAGRPARPPHPPREGGRRRARLRRRRRDARRRRQRRRSRRPRASGSTARDPAKLETDHPATTSSRRSPPRYDRLLNTHTPDDVRRALVKTLDVLRGRDAARARRRLLGPGAVRGDGPAPPARPSRASAPRGSTSSPSTPRPRRRRPSATPRAPRIERGDRGAPRWRSRAS